MEILSAKQKKDCGKGQPPSRFCAARRWPVLLMLCVVLWAAGWGCQSLFRQPSGLERVQDAGMLRIAIDPSFAPFEYVNDQGHMAGFDVDLATLVAEGLGVQAHFVTTGYDALYDALTAGRADVIVSALYPDPGRSAGFVFSKAYFDAGNVLLVPQEVNIAGPEDLDGLKLAFQFGTDAHMQALEWQESLPGSLGLVPLDDVLSIKDALRQGRADAVLLDRVSALSVMRQVQGLTLLPQAISEEPYVIAARNEDQDLIKAIQIILESLDQRGEIDVLVERWMH